MTNRPEFEEWLADDDKKRFAWEWTKRRIAELTGTTLDANGDLDEDALTEEGVHGAMAVIQAEAAVYAAPERAEMEALDDELLDESITEVFFSMPEEDRNTIRRLMSGEMSEDERNTLIRRVFREMSEDERNTAIRQMSEDDRNTIRRLMHMDDGEETP
jgi:hypothetical protein